MENVVKETVKNYRRDIDGLRAIAIILVVLYHSGVGFLSGGFIGVDVFFVISGFLIGGIIYTETTQNKFSYSKFYVRRIKRIAPALIAMLIVCSAFAFFYLSALELKDFSLFSSATILSVPNIMLWHKTNYFSPSAELNPLLMTWSLGVEEQFYIFLPIIFSIIVKANIKVVKTISVLSIASFILCIILTKTSPLFSFFMLPTRAWELGAGVIISIMHKEGRFNSLKASHREWLFLAGLAMILFAALTFDKKTEFPGYSATLPVLGSIFLILSNGKLSSIILGNRVMVFIGLVSYSWYLWHWPLLSFARIGIDERLSLHAGLLISTVALFIAYLSYLFVETPFRKRVHLSNPKIIFGYILVSAALLLPTALGYLLKGIPQRLSPEVVQVDKDKLERVADRCLVGYGAKTYSRDETCLPNSSQDAVALVGDSHAAALRGGVEKYAKNNNLVVYQINKASCPMLVGATRTINTYPAHGAECDEFNKNALNLISENKKIKTVIISALWDSAIYDNSGSYKSTVTTETGISALSSGLNELVNQLKAARKEVIIVSDVPQLDFDVVKNIDNQQIPLRKLINSLLSREKTADEFTVRYQLPHSDVNDLLTSIAQEKGIRKFNPADNLCDNTGCKFKSKDRPFYYDNQHLTTLGSIYALHGL
ncbi:acyltransferase [Serratia marcescens]|nr:acyltransferase [Serratia marcescens]